MKWFGTILFLLTACRDGAVVQEPIGERVNNRQGGVDSGGTGTVVVKDNSPLPSTSTTTNTTNNGTQGSHDPAGNSDGPPPLPSGSTNLPVIGDVAIDHNPNVPLGIPRDKAGRPAILISRRQYLLSWNPDLKSINWAAWIVEPAQLGSESRRDHFDVDGELEKYLAPKGQHAMTPDDYTGSCFDRGHQVPSGDRTASVEDNSATFLMSNIAPQSAYLNRVIWEHLEERERRLAKSDTGHRIVVVAGPLYDQVPPKLGGSGAAKAIAVPKASFKAFLVLPLGGGPGDVSAQTPIVVALMPNITSTGKLAATDHTTACQESQGNLGPTSGTSTDWEVYRTTLGSLERETQLEFFPLMPTGVHDKLAATPSSN